MAVYQVVQWDLRAGLDAEQQLAAVKAMHEYASYVRAELPDVSISVFRDPASEGHFNALYRFAARDAIDACKRAEGTRIYEAALAPLLAGPLETREYEVVTSSDLAPRPKPRDPSRTRARRGR